MKISPIDIRQHTFEKGFRGYEIDEVNAFLNSLSQEWERVMQENKMLKMQLDIAEKELNKLRDVEMTLFRTLKTAEESSAQIAEQANHAAEKYLQESRRQTDAQMEDIKRKASMIVQDAHNQARFVREEILNELKNQERDFKAMENYRDNLVVQLKTLANNTHETVERFEKKFSSESSFATHFQEAKQQVTSLIETKSQPEEAPLPDDDQPESEAFEIRPEEHADVVVVSEAFSDTYQEESVNGVEQPYHAPENEPADAYAPEEGRDAAAEAMAEVEKLAQLRQQQTDQALEPTESSSDEEDTTHERASNKGSFFDQIT